MNNLIKINNKEIKVKEFENQRVVTFKDIDMVHERLAGTASRNFRENRNRFIKGIDYFEITKEEVATNFGGSFEEYGFSKYAASGILITESGYLMIVKSLTDDLAWRVQRELVNNYFRGKQLIQTLNELSPQLQLLINMELKQSELEVAVTETKKAVIETKEEVQTIKDVITVNPKAEWRKETNRILNAIGRQLDDYQGPRNEAYEALKERANCRPNVLVNNLKKRALKNGMAPSKVEKLNILDVLENDVRLREIYVTIVKEMAIKYGVSLK